METPGSILKTEREKQKKSLETIEKQLNIKLDNLKAIESDNYELLPPEFFLKSYLRLYADTLGLDPSSIIELYESRKTGASVKDRAPKHPGTELPAPPIREKPAAWSTNKTVAAVVIVALIVLSLAVFVKYKKQGPPAEVNSTMSAPETVAVQEKLSLTVIATKLTWVSVKVDSANPREWLLRPGEDIELRAIEKFTIKIGNAGGTRLTLNGRDMGVLGPNGKVVDIVLP